MSFGGHTVTLGNFIFAMGCFSMVVLIGLSDQLVNDWLIKRVAIVNPVNTTSIQKNLANLLSVEI